MVATDTRAVRAIMPRVHAARAQVYESSLWTTSRTLDPTSLALDHSEAKLDAFNLFPLFTVRVGMSDVHEGGSTSFIDLPLPRQYTSMQELMSNEQFVPTHAGRSAWLGLAVAGEEALEQGCNREGFNNKISTGDAYLSVRVGVLGGPAWWGPGEASCQSYYMHSFIGLGAKSFQSVMWPCYSPLNYGASFSTGALARVCPNWDGWGQQVLRPKMAYLLGGNTPPAPPPPSPPPPSPPPPSPPPPPPPPPSPPPPPPPPPSPPPPPPPPSTPPLPPSPPLPPYSSVCDYAYLTLNDDTRRVTNTDRDSNRACDSGYFDTHAWYRLTSSTGFDFMPESPPGEWLCGTHATGWLNGVHPAAGAEPVASSVCFDWYGHCQWSTPVNVVQCSGFFLYQFTSGVPACSLRICTSDVIPANFLAAL
jgi:hypothetical protein